MNIFLLYIGYSLKTFVKICRQHVFSLCVREVQLSCARSREDTSTEVVASMLEAYEDHHDFVHGCRTISERCDAESLAHEDAESLLDQPFEELAQSDDPITLSVSTDERESFGSSKGHNPKLALEY